MINLQSSHVHIFSIFILIQVQPINQWLELTDIKQEVQIKKTKRMTNLRINYSSQSTNKCNLYCQQQRTCIIPVLIQHLGLFNSKVWPVFSQPGGSHLTSIHAFSHMIHLQVFFVYWHKEKEIIKDQHKLYLTQNLSQKTFTSNFGMERNTFASVFIIILMKCV